MWNWRPRNGQAMRNGERLRVYRNISVAAVRQVHPKEIRPVWLQRHVSEKLATSQGHFGADKTSAIRLDTKIILVTGPGQVLNNSRDGLLRFRAKCRVVQRNCGRTNSPFVRLPKDFVRNSLTQRKYAGPARDYCERIDGGVSFDAEISLQPPTDVRHLRRPTDQNDL